MMIILRASIKVKVRQESTGASLATWNSTWFGLYPHYSNKVHGSLRTLLASTIIITQIATYNYQLHRSINVLLTE